MAFKIKDGVRIGTKDVLNNSGQLLAPVINGNVTSHDGNDITVLDPVVTRETAVQDGVRLLGRAGGTTSLSVTLTPAALTANRTITLPDATGTLALSSQIVNTTYAISTEPGDTIYDEKIRLTGSDATTDDIKLAVGAVDAVYGLTIEETGDTITFKHADTSSATTLTADGRTYVTGLSFDAYGHVTGYTTGTETVVDTNTTSLPIENSAGTVQFTSTDTTGLQFAASGSVSVAFDATNYRVTISGTDTNTDTLQSVANDTTVADRYIHFVANATGAQTALSNNGLLYNPGDNVLKLSGDLQVNGGDLTTSATTFNLINTTATTVNFAGAGTAVNIGASTGTTNVKNNLTVTGNLIVNGTTTTVNSTVTTLDDPVITLGGDTAPISDDNKDRGVEFRWHNGTAAKLGFFGFDDSTGKFTFIPDATNTTEVFSGTKGELDANVDWANILNKPTIPTDTNTTYSISAETTTGGAFVRLTGSDASTDDVKLAQGTNVTITRTDANTITISAAATAPNNGTLTLTATEDAATGDSVIVGTGTGFSADTASNATYNVKVGPALSALANTMTGAGSGFLKKTAQDTYTVDTNTYLTAEADTLQSVTTRGNKTNTAIILQEATTDVSARQAFVETVATTTATPIDLWATATYRSAKYLVQITQDTSYQVSEILIIFSGTTTYMTEYAVLETNGPLATFTSDVNTGNARLIVTMAAANSATIKIDRVAMYI